MSDQLGRLDFKNPGSDEIEKFTVNELKQHMHFRCKTLSTPRTDWVKMIYLKNILNE